MDNFLKKGESDPRQGKNESRNRATGKRPWTGKKDARALGKREEKEDKENLPIYKRRKRKPLCLNLVRSKQLEQG